MELLKNLLDNYIILKENDKDVYYDIKDNLSSFKAFIQDKLGYDILIHPDFIKLEKFPGKVETWMGIRDFEEKLDYCLFILIIMFLEDKGKEEQFVLSQLVEYISSNFEEEKIDWTVYSTRRSLIRVLKFSSNLRLIKITDGDEVEFINSSEGEVLYENTGISKYVIRPFPMDIALAKSYKDFIDFAWNEMDRDRGTLRKNRVYRSLLFSPVVYNGGSEDQDYYYIKNYKNILENDFEKYLGWKLHIHKEAALLTLGEEDRCKDYFPGINALTDIVLCLNKKVLEKVTCRELIPKEDSSIELTKEEFIELLSELRDEKASGWSKEYREAQNEYLYKNVVSFMKEYSMLFEKEHSIVLMPLIGKIIGDYPKDYIAKENKVEQQMDY